MFPDDTINVHADQAGNGSTTLASLDGTSTVLYESFNTGFSTKGATLLITCNSTVLLNINDFSLTPHAERFKFAKCSPSSTITFAVNGATGNGTTTVSLLYIPRDPNTPMNVDQNIINNPTSQCYTVGQTQTCYRPLEVYGMYLIDGLAVILAIAVVVHFIKKYI